MPTATSDGIDVYYVEDGDPSGEPLLLVMGFTAQLTAWPQGFVDLLGRRGYRVIRLDNRDCGLSGKLHGVRAEPMKLLTGGADPADVPYRLTDMAADAVGLLDHLGIERAHLVGASMGGMIVQTIAIEHPDRVLSLCSIMSTTGAPEVGAPTAEALTALLTPPPSERDAILARSVEVTAVIGSKTHPMPADQARARAAAAFDRCFYPEGAIRQFTAIIASGDRTEALGAVDVPTVVIHGDEDPLITPSGGRATAAAIPGAELVEMTGMGHDLPEPLWPTIVDAIDKNTRRA